MPVDGLLPSLADRLPSFSPRDGVTLEQVEILHFFTEVPSESARAALPPALHPTIPGAAYATFLRCEGSPWGPFTLAEVRIAARLREKPRAYLIAAVIDGADEAATALSEGWAMQFRPGEVRLQRWYDRVEGSVSSEGRTVVDAALMDPEPVPGATLQYGPWASPVTVQDRPGILLVDPLIEFGDDRQRGVPRIAQLDAEWCGVSGIRSTLPIGAFYATADIRLATPTTWLEPQVPSGGSAHDVP